MSDSNMSLLNENKLREAKFWLANKSGRMAWYILRLLGRNATTLPGLVATTIDPHFLEKFGTRLDVALVSGTNGKTTTANLLSQITQAAGAKQLIYNGAGSNLSRGIASAIVAKSLGSSAQAIFETDEADLVYVDTALKPKLIVLLNLFRDQMDRYGELDKTAYEWRRLFAQERKVDFLLNADDPNLGWLGKHHRNTEFFGIYNIIGKKKGASAEIPRTADIIISPHSGELLVFNEVYFSHMGDYHDMASDFKRPKLNYAICDVNLRGLEGTSFVIKNPQGKVLLNLKSPLPGIYNVYNAAAAGIAALRGGIERNLIEHEIGKFSGVSGRLETIEVGPGRRLIVALVKNPTGFNLLIDLLRVSVHTDLNLVIGINDLLADGTDVSWLWDVDFENLKSSVRQIIATGTRGQQVALRLKYSGLAQTVTILPNVAETLEKILNDTAQMTVCCLSYTAMVQFRSLLLQRRIIQHPSRSQP